MIKVPYHLLPLSELKCEDDHQRALTEWTELPETLTKYPMLKQSFRANPNGGKRSKATGALLKATGVKAGTPDITISYPANGFHGMFIEMKYGRNKPSKEQQQFIAHHTDLGYHCVVCWTWIEAKRQIINYLSEF